MTFIDVYRRRGLKVKSDKNKGMVLGGEEGVLDESGTDEAECSRKGARGRKVAGVIS